jgi:hypothetical protein
VGAVLQGLLDPSYTSLPASTLVEQVPSKACGLNTAVAAIKLTAPPHSRRAESSISTGCVNLQSDSELSYYKESGAHQAARGQGSRPSTFR